MHGAVQIIVYDTEMQELVRLTSAPFELSLPLLPSWCLLTECAILKLCTMSPICVPTYYTHVHYCIVVVQCLVDKDYIVHCDM